MIRTNFNKIVLFGALALLMQPMFGSYASAGPYEDAFSNRIAQPGDQASLASFIEIAVDSGQYDQALSTIEQHLITYPRDAQARLYAARLYYHVSSYDLAKRQVEHALSIGTLNGDETDDAEELRGLIDKGLGGLTGYVSFTIGADLVHTDFASTAAISDRTDFNPYGEVTASLKRSLDTPSDDAIILSASARVARRFGDFDLSGAGGVFAASSGRASITWEKGLPNSGISSLRMGLTAYGEYFEFQRGLAISEFGAEANFTVQPSLDSTFFAKFGYANLSASQLLFTDHRLRAEIGGTQRVSGNHAIGAALRGEFDYDSGGTFVGRSLAAELSYAGVVWSKANGPVWTQRVSFGAGHVMLPDLSATPGTTFDGNFWDVNWDHRVEINDRNRIDVRAFYRSLDLDTPSRNSSSYGIGLSFTHTIF